ncbi:MAG: hypothetical protein H7X95_04330, partial [Deltaproteobacteria bacterium]|nr:hypothetical protein [Deltaproteobacteria bacterium]
MRHPMHRHRNSAWLIAGLCAGAAVGAGDTLWAVGRGVGGLGGVKALQLVLLGASWLAIAGLVVGGLLAIAGFLLDRVGRRADLW